MNTSYTSIPLPSSQRRGVSSHEMQIFEITHKPDKNDKALKAEDTLRMDKGDARMEEGDARLEGG